MPSAESPNCEPVPDLAAIQEKYEQEKAKRLRSDNIEQYVELGSTDSDRIDHLVDDPYVDHDTLNQKPSNLQHGDDLRVLILGCGYGGLQNAVRLVEAGIKADDFRLVDVAGGFGGTWWWNRYPGLHCDVESSIYMPFLDKTGYIPKNRYSASYELREYADLLAKHWNFAAQAVFRTKIVACEWDDGSRRWKVKLKQNRGPSESPLSFSITSQFVILASGVLNHPKIPKLEGIEGFRGDLIHTARWNYNLSGGSEYNWELSKLKGKRIGVIGTGATSVQMVPKLAKWASELYIFQRTPSAIENRGQRPTDVEAWKKMASEDDWQKKRMTAWSAALSGEPGYEDPVKDGWTAIPTYKFLIGGPHEKPVAMEEIPGHIGQAIATDANRMERLRKRVADTVEDRATAELLKPWYPSWCKRPLFHDEYLPTFNLPHVKLIDASKGKGINTVTPRGIMHDGKEYELDVLIFATGYRPSAKDNMRPGSPSDTIVVGRNGNIAIKWDEPGATTLHGILTNGCPNLLLTGPTQTGVSANYALVQGIIAEHTAYLISEAVKRSGDASRATLEATEEAEQTWTLEIMSRTGWIAVVGVCGPSYINMEGKQHTQAEMVKYMRAAPYLLGLNAYTRVLESWRAAGTMDGIQISS